MSLKFLWHKHLFVRFLKKLVALNLKLYRERYALHNPYWSEQWAGFKRLLKKFITLSFQVQWSYNLYDQKSLNVQFHLKMVSLNFDLCRSKRTIRRTDGSQGFSFQQSSLSSFLSFLLIHQPKPRISMLIQLNKSYIHHTISY